MYGEPSIRPFQFSRLPKVRRAERTFFDALARSLPSGVFSSDVLAGMMQMLQQFIHAPIAYQWMGKEQFLDLNQIERICLSPTLLMEIAFLPMDARVLVELDPRIAAIMIDRALGGTGDNVESIRSLMDVEKGVLTFLLLKCIQHLQSAWGDSARMEFRLSRFFEQPQKMRDSFSTETLFYRKELQIGTLNQYGFLRLYLPIDLVHEIVRSQPEDRTSGKEFQRFQERFPWIENTPLVGRVRVGVVDLTQAEIAALEAEDIVLLRECTASRNENGLLQGEAILQYGPKASLGLRCLIRDAADHPSSQISLEEILSIAQPSAQGILDRSDYDMADSSQSYDYQKEAPHPMDQENFGQMGSVVSDVPVPLVVELGRVETRARDIMHLRLGQILELRRSPYEPLDLVVNGQLRGKGELVEIEGQLGVRIIELYK